MVNLLLFTLKTRAHTRTHTHTHTALFPSCHKLHMIVICTVALLVKTYSLTTRDQLGQGIDESGLFRVVWWFI